ncbi:MAG: hypothetical protein CM15mP60_2880 [Alphaproteobacteria bacterium]|nr:MAG: hypothetical protein CM15mP60_2880 [Alphaproteobacteria bacterium]
MMVLSICSALTPAADIFRDPPRHLDSFRLAVLGYSSPLFPGLIIGGVSGYYGGWIDSCCRCTMQCERSGDPLFMAIAAFFPRNGPRNGFFFISLIFGLWLADLARRVRTHLLTERNQEYVLAARAARRQVTLLAAPFCQLH